MNKKRIITIAAISAITLVIAGAAINKINHKKEKEDINSESMVPENINDIPAHILEKVAPDVEQDFKSTAKDFESHDINGNEVMFSDYKGQYIVLHFWNSKSEGAAQELKSFEEVMKKYEGQVTFFMVNMVGSDDETLETATQFLSENNIEINTLFDDHYDARVNYKVTSLPKTVFIDKDGLIQKNIKYALNTEILEKQIINLINN